MATYPTWVASYELEMGRNNNDHEAAVKYADKVVRKTQPAASPKDLSYLQRGGQNRTETIKIFTMFYSFFSVFQNRMHETNLKYRTGDINIVQAFTTYFWIMLAPAILAGLIQKRRWLEGSEWWKEPIGYMVAAYPFLRDVIQPIFSGFDYSKTPVEKALEAPSDIVKVWKSKKKRTEKAITRSIGLSGYLLGLPTAQLQITIDGIIDLMQHRTSKISRLFFREEKKKKRKKISL